MGGKEYSSKEEREGEVQRGRKREGKTDEGRGKGRGRAQWDTNTYANVANYEHSLRGISIFITALLS